MTPEESDENDIGDCWWFPKVVCMCVQESVEKKRNNHKRSKRAGCRSQTQCAMIGTCVGLGGFCYTCFAFFFFLLLRGICYELEYGEENNAL